MVVRTVRLRHATQLFFLAINRVWSRCVDLHCAITIYAEIVPRCPTAVSGSGHHLGLRASARESYSLGLGRKHDSGGICTSSKRRSVLSTCSIIQDAAPQSELPRTRVFDK